ncbi:MULTISPECIES: inner membrane-spanning protein YciB [Thioclava]|uniref:Inner membrane-spanning protein YciB n=1 Tax=Thioclava nitratireducens TaxID=1915078 RepID=A0ABM6IFM2_9RHOB|nr:MULTISPECIES: inner membrane-spanning protein YciB [Thioclava]AQS47582.1 intracellular septation protein A [Thioclava nitratireducens]OWY10983.1 intracellular septation protein A [Thioclava sp. F42-5]OWY13947.1 intracellular septation protein A [Thioclava sp. F34-6]PWE51220.1 septation protein A [Thioclava sp. NG1]WGT50954.1 inner membrane-spanning protein YciB [Thioclava nitratireducens]
MAEKKISPWVKAALDWGPLIVFFVAFNRLKDGTYAILGTDYSGFVVATALFIPLIAASTLILWALTRKISAMQIATLVLVLIFGGLSVWLNDPTFFKMKPTIIYLLFAGILGAGLIRGKAWLQLVMNEAIPMAHEGWMILTKRFVGLFLALAVANEIVWRTMSDEIWVDFKTFGLPIILIVFIMSQTKLFERHGIEKEEGDEAEK